LIDPAIAAAMALVPALSAQPPASWRVETLPSLSNRVLRVTGAGGDFVLRLANEAPYLDRVREVHNHRLAAGIGLAPPVLFDDPERGILLTVFQPQAATFDRQPNRRRAIEATARSLQRLHQSGLRFKGEMRLAPTMDEYLAIAGAAGRRVATIWDRWRPDIVPVLTGVEAQLVPSHVDPVPRNILVSLADGAAHVRFVDWEYSAPAAPVWDLADFSVEAELNRDEEAALLSTYGIETGSTAGAAFRLCKPMLDLLAAAWAASQAALHGNRAEQAGMIETRLARAKGALDRPDFAALLAAGRAH
jgi:thiamine kinase